MDRHGIGSKNLDGNAASETSVKKIYKKSETKTTHGRMLDPFIVA